MEKRRRLLPQPYHRVRHQTSTITLSEITCSSDLGTFCSTLFKIDQKLCSTACYHRERSSGYTSTFRTYNPLYQFVRFKDIQEFKDYCYYTRCIVCRRFLTKGVNLI
ncbi:uncharacterized protein LOC111038023 [Myzus persicae]|uniref:uncharacterized protein LOC111038023 n=1 Tax=Myzus persicae TaxID=13164 RepID=UPI000B9381E7|nr:uncharacterized protein LOC111038023 [Myzus persicae]